MRMGWSIGLMLAVAAGATPPAADRAPGVASSRITSGRLIAKPRTSTQAIARAGLTIIRDDEEVGEWVVQVPVGETDADASQRLQRTGRFEYVHPDWIVSPAIEPNDPLYPSQWHMPRLNLPAAWELTIGSAGVIVAVCDSGVDLDHPDLAAVLVPGFNAADNLPQSSGGLVGPTNDHGTAVAGCAGAVGDNGVGVAGAGWDLRVMPIRVTNLASGNAFLSDINRGARWAVEHGAKVVNISYNGVASPTNSTTGKYLKDRGASCVWAAGNSNSVASSVDLPDLVVVGASTATNTRATFSNFGPAIDVIAPGVGILMPRVDGWASNDGTSFAAPLTAGVLGLIRSANPGWGPSEAELALQLTAFDLGTPGRDDTFGHGLVDAGRAVRLAVDALTVPMAPAARADSASGLSGSQLDIDVLANDIDLNGDVLTPVLDSSETPAGPMSVVAGPHGRPVVRVQISGAFAGVFTINYSAVDPGGLASRSSASVAVARRPKMASFTPIVIPNVPGEIRRIRAADLDADGDLDLVAGTLATDHSISFLQNINGVFTVAGYLSLPTGGEVFDVADLNRDGRADIVSTSRSLGRIAVALSVGPYEYASPVLLPSTAPGDVVLTTESGLPLDINGDGFTDAVVCNQTASTAEYRLGDGAGGLGAATRAGFLGTGPVAIKAADVNADGRADLVAVSNSNVTISTLLATGPAAFASARFSPLPVTPIDMLILSDDGVGPVDVAVLSQGVLGEPQGVSLMKSRGANASVVGLFDPMTFLNAFDSVALGGGDFNADSLGDITIAERADRRLAVLPATAGGEDGASITLVAGGARWPSGLVQVASLRTAKLRDSTRTDVVLGGTAAGPAGVRGAVEIWWNESRPDCVADFDGDGLADGFDYDLFVACFEGGACVPGRSPDISRDGFVDAFDYQAFVTLFEEGCPG